MGLSNYMMLSSLTAVLTTLIRVNWGQEAMCSQLPGLWPSPGLLSAVESSLGGDGKRWEDWASASPPRHLHPGWVQSIAGQQGADLEAACAVWGWADCRPPSFKRKERVCRQKVLHA